MKELIGLAFSIALIYISYNPSVIQKILTSDTEIAAHKEAYNAIQRGDKKLMCFNNIVHRRSVLGYDEERNEWVINTLNSEHRISANTENCVVVKSMGN